MTLQEIGLKHGTDKATTHLYMDNYSKYLEPLRDKEFVLLELGVAGGGSIKTWREYFPNAKVYGVDNNADCAGEGIFIGSVTDEAFLQSVLDQIGEVTVLIDDSSHCGDDMIKIFQFLFPKISKDGWLILEDTHTLYSVHYSGNYESNGRTRGYNFFADLIYHVDIAGRGMTGNASYALSVENPTFDPVPEYSTILDSIHIHPSLWLFKRK